MVDSAPCEYAETDSAARYIQGRLAGDEAERFEQHYFACEICWTEVQAGLALRASSPRQAARPSRSAWRLLPAAAVLLLVAGAGWVVLRERVAPFDAVRSAAPAWSIRAELRNGQLVAHWPPVARAASYRLLVHAPDGSPLAELEASSSSLRLPAGSFAPHEEVFLVVEAIDVSGAVIDRSPPEVVEIR